MVVWVQPPQLYKKTAPLAVRYLRDTLAKSQREIVS